MPFCKEDNSITNPKPDNVDAVCFIRSDIEKLPTMDIPQGAGHKNDKDDHYNRLKVTRKRYNDFRLLKQRWCNSERQRLNGEMQNDKLDEQQSRRNLAASKMKEYCCGNNELAIMDMNSPEHIVYDPELQFRYQLPGGLKVEEFRKCYLFEDDIDYLLDRLIRFNGGTVLDPRKCNRAWRRTKNHENETSSMKSDKKQEKNGNKKFPAKSENKQAPVSEHLKTSIPDVVVDDDDNEHLTDQEARDLFLGKPLTFVNPKFKSSIDNEHLTDHEARDLFLGKPVTFVNSKFKSSIDNEHLTVQEARDLFLGKPLTFVNSKFKSVCSNSFENPIKNGDDVGGSCSTNSSFETKQNVTNPLATNEILSSSTCSESPSSSKCSTIKPDETDHCSTKESSKENIEPPINNNNNNSDNNFFTSNNTPLKKNNQYDSPKSKTRHRNRKRNLVVMFEKYYTLKDITVGLENKTMAEGVLRINPKQDNEAYISSNSDVDILISGIINRNRALQGDEVVVEFLPENHWKKLPNGVNQKTAKVVYIKLKIHSRTAIGSLVPSKFNDCSSKIMCVPRDNRLPVVNILYCLYPPISLAQLENELEQKKDYLYVVQIIRWDSVKYAEGIIMDEVGIANSLETETKFILLENNIDPSPLNEFMCHLPDINSIKPENEAINRLDLRDWCIFSIDPEGARDLDDALSCRLLSNGNYQVGVHISDVSYYIPADNPLDSIIMQRATSVYLNHIVYHMLPEQLCDICSLKPGSDKLTFSVIIEMTKDAEVVSKKFSRSVIRSRGQFTYFHAQQAIEKGSAVFETPDIFPTMYDGMTLSDFVEVVTHLQHLAVVMRKKRFEGGALSLNQPKLQFYLNPETNMPEKFHLFVAQDSNRLVEEFMLLANNLVAKYIYEKFPNLALLRCHPPPHPKMLKELAENLSKLSIDIGIETAGAIQQSINRYIEDDPEKDVIFSSIICKPMLRASYTCPPQDGSIDDMWHYALNMPFYTHFTSPIRRYPDIIVHRFLAAALNYEKLPNWSRSDINNVVDICNKKKLSSKRASEMSTVLFTKLYFMSHGPAVMEGVVINIKDYSFDFIVLPIGLVSRCFTKFLLKRQNLTAVHTAVNGIYTVVLKFDDDLCKLEQVIKHFTKLKVEVYFDKKENKVMTNFISVID